MFADQRLRDLELRYARRSVAWDALRYGDQRADLDAWVNGALDAGAEPLVTLARSLKSNGKRYRSPTLVQYLREFLRMRSSPPTCSTSRT